MFRGNHKLLMIKDAFRSIFASRFGLKNMKVPFVGEIFEFFFFFGTKVIVRCFS